MNVVDLKCELDEPPPWLPEYEEFCYNVLDYMKIDRWEVSLVLCDDPFIIELNRNYRSKDEPTDVLSFPQDDHLHAGESSCVGDIVISLPSVERNAESFGVDVFEELKRVYIHGLLHLKGMNHPTNNADEPMLQLQENTLQAVTGDM